MKERVFTYPVAPLKSDDWFELTVIDDKIDQDVSDFVHAAVVQLVKNCSDKDGLRITIRVEGVEYGEED